MSISETFWIRSIFPSAIQTMMDEHQTILRVLACVEKLVSDERCAGEPADTFAKAARFLREYADALHHGKEEDLLFPAMEASGLQAEAGPTALEAATAATTPTILEGEVGGISELMRASVESGVSSEINAMK